MQEPFFIKKIAVLGAGVMGSQIAAHCVNAGIETLLFDLAAKEGPANALVDKAIAHLLKLKPSPWACSETASFLQAKNYETDLVELLSCDLIIEAIAERMEWKDALYQRIVPHLAPHSILVSNTSGLGIDVLSKALPVENRKNFCGVHFFNPPRYMHLVELIPAKTTSPVLLDYLEAWLTSDLGKGVVRAKDTPNFIANRVGVFSLLAIMAHTETFGLGLDEVDALTGTLLGRPKSATYRTMDVVGLDTMQHVIHTMQEQLKDDPWHSCFILPDWLKELISQGHLGQKSGQGLYRKNGKVIEVYDVKTKSYRLANAVVSDEVQQIMTIDDPARRMQSLMASMNNQAQFIVACLNDLFHYSAYHLECIASTVRDIDCAMRWGFGWQQGPFEIWQLAGIGFLAECIKKSIHNNRSLSTAKLPDWLVEVGVFYNEQGAYCPATRGYQERSQLPVYKKQFFPDRVLCEKSRSMSLIYENKGVILQHLQDDIALLGFKSKANTIGQDVLDGLEAAIEQAEAACRGVIIYQKEASNFSSGADLRGVAALIKDNKWRALDEMIFQFQQVVMRLKYSSIPVIAALRGRALGGGCEIMMHCDAIVASFEAYPGLVELGVGVIPAGGGCKEMALRASQHANQSELMTSIQKYFQQIATAQVAGSATEGFQMGYLRPADSMVMHPNEVLYAAIKKIDALQAGNYHPPLTERLKVAGIEGHAKLQVGLVNWLEGGFISQHDYVLANELASVLCGGNLNQGTWVDEQWVLKLERDAFLRLAETSLTQARINSLLATGKPLRN